jgi:hypothetical protein
VALDGSALHLAAYVLSPQARVAIILRRTSANVADYLLQYRSFLGITPDVIDVIRCDWISGDNTRADFRSVGELDFSALFGQLAALGHLPEGFRAELPSPKEIAAIMDIQSGRRGDILRATQRGAHVPGSAET